MSLRYMVFGLTLGLAACTAQAQQSMPDMPGMPGMKMNAPASKPQQQQPAPAAARPPQPKASNVPISPAARDMTSKVQDTADAKARAAAASVEQSIQQQAGQPHTKPAENSDTGSVKLPVQELQEPEAVDFKTGTDLPAPELLREVLHQQPMTLDSFLEMADRLNPTLAQAQRNVDRSKQQGRQASLPPDPVVGYSGDHIRGGEYGGGEQGAFFSQEIVLAHKLGLRRDIYRAEAHSNELAVEIQRARIHNDVGRAFFDALAEQESVIVHDRLLKVALDAETNAHELERVGQADASDVLNAEIAAEQAKVEFETTQRMFLAAFAQIATFAGQTSLTPHPLTGGLVEPPELDAESMVATDMQESPAVRQAQANVAVAEARVRSAQREKIPDLNIKAGEWYSGERLGATTIKTGPESFAEAGVQLPLWNRNQGNVAASKAELDRARQDVTRVQLLTQNRAEPLAQHYQTARSTAARYRMEMIPRARRAYELEVTKYQQMGQIYPHVLAAQHMLFTLQLSYIQALHEEWTAAIALENYALMNALDEPMSVGQDTTTTNLPTASAGGN